MIQDYFCLKLTGKTGKEGIAELKMNSVQVRAKDVIPIAMLTGIVITLFIFIIVMLNIPSSDGFFHKELFLRELPIYRSTLILIMSFLGTAVCVAYFREYKINYVYIFGIVAINKMNQYQLYKIFLLLITLWMVTTLVEILEIKHYMSIDFVENH